MRDERHRTRMMQVETFRRGLRVKGTVGGGIAQRGQANRLETNILHERLHGNHSIDRKTIIESLGRACGTNAIHAEPSSLFGGPFA